MAMRSGRNLSSGDLQHADDAEKVSLFSHLLDLVTSILILK